MLIYFLGGESEFARSAESRFLNGGDLRFFKKIGSFVRAVRANRPELILADQSFLNNFFDLRKFLFEERVDVPIMFVENQNKTLSTASFFEPAQAQDLLYKIKEKCKISQKLFELFKYLYNSAGAVPLEKMRVDLSRTGTRFSSNSMNVSLSRLKKLLSAQEDCKIRLVKESLGYRLVNFREEKFLRGLANQFVQFRVEP